MSEVLLEIRGLEKTFPGVRALKGVNLTVNKGEVHSLMGENGAGKSTLIKVLTGIYQKNELSYSTEKKSIVKLQLKQTKKVFPLYIRN